MPSGKIHALTSAGLGMSIPAAAGAYMAGTGSFEPGLVVAGLAGGAGALLGLFLTPDLDLAENMTRYYGPFDLVRRLLRARHLWAALGGFAATAWWWYWLPYGWIAPHRSPLSHIPFVGTTLRLVYAGWPLLVLWGLAGFPAPSEAALLGLWYGFLGLGLSDTAHFALDALTGWR